MNRSKSAKPGGYTHGETINQTLAGSHDGGSGGRRPEVACLAAVSPEVLEIARPVIIGDGTVIAEALQLLKIPAEGVVVNEIGVTLPGMGRLLVYQHGELDWPNLKKGQVSEEAGGPLTGTWKRRLRWLCRALSAGW